MTSSPRSRIHLSQSVRQVMMNIFSPCSIAVVGAAREVRKGQIDWVRMLLNFGYKGRIYPVNPKTSEIWGLKAYPSVKDIPDSIDYAIIVVPRHVVPSVLEECVSKGVKAVHIFTAGFAEVGDQEGEELQAELKRIISGSATHVIGPNCLGVYCPDGGITFDTESPPEPGPIGFITQSGMGGRRLLHIAIARGLRFSKVVSFGNAIDLSAEDFLGYLTLDPETKVVLLYIEGLTDGQRFFRTVREATKVKPVVILAGGLSESGAGAAASHTGAMTGKPQVWQAFFRQTGAIRVQSFEEAVEQLIATLNLPPIKGTAVGLVGRGGGLGVVTTEICEGEGLKVPQFTPEVRKRLAEITPVTAGSSVRNPVEIGLGRAGVSKYYSEGLRIVASDPQVNFILTFINPEEYVQWGIEGWDDDFSQRLIEIAKVLPKPLVVGFVPCQNLDVLKGVQEVERRCQQAGIACFPSLEAAIKAVSKLIKYYEFLEGGIDDQPTNLSNNRKMSR